PGFHGNLSLPLHNLTANDYKLVGGEGLIWVEVTKIRPSKVAQADAEPRRGRTFALPIAKKDLTLRQYLRKADPNRAIRSSIPGLLQDANVRLREAQSAAQQAVAAADRVQRRELIAAAIGVVGVILAAVAVFTAVHGLIDTTNFRVDATNGRIDQLSQQVRPSASPDVIQRQLSQLNARICQLELQ